MSLIKLEFQEMKIEIDEKIATILNIPFIDPSIIGEITRVTIKYPNLILPLKEGNLNKIIDKFRNNGAVISTEFNIFHLKNCVDISSYYGNDYHFITQCIMEEKIPNIPLFRIFKLYDLETVPCKKITDQETDSSIYTGNNSITLTTTDDHWKYIDKVYKIKNKYLLKLMFNVDMEAKNEIEIHCQLLDKEGKVYFNIFFQNEDTVRFSYGVTKLNSGDSQVLEQEKKIRKYLFFEALDMIGLNPDPKEVLPLIGQGADLLENIYRKWAKFRNAKKKALLSGLIR
jgi:hypothetical protein